MVKDGTATTRTSTERGPATAAQLLGGLKVHAQPEPEPERDEPLSEEEYRQREAAALDLKNRRSKAIRTQPGFVMGLGASWSPEGSGSSTVRNNRPRAA